MKLAADIVVKLLLGMGVALTFCVVLFWVAKAIFGG